MMDRPRFIIFSAGCNCVSYVGKHIRSILRQQYKNYIHVVVDDTSIDNTDGIIRDHMHSKMVFYRNQKNVKWIHNAVQYLPKHIKSDEDVIVIVDLDDWLTSKRVLTVLANVYEKKKCWVTYGSFAYYIDGKIEPPWISSYSNEVVAERSFRKVSWKWWHPKTFKAFLWKSLKRKDLYGPNKKFPPFCYDKAIGFPILEMTPPDKLVHIKDTLYVYNVDNPRRTTKLKKGKGLGGWYRDKQTYKILERND